MDNLADEAAYFDNALQVSALAEMPRYKVREALDFIKRWPSADMRATALTTPEIVKLLIRSGFLVETLALMSEVLSSAQCVEQLITLADDKCKRMPGLGPFNIAYRPQAEALIKFVQALPQELCNTILKNDHIFDELKMWGYHRAMRDLLNGVPVRDAPVAVSRPPRA